MSEKTSSDKIQWLQCEDGRTGLFVSSDGEIAIVKGGDGLCCTVPAAGLVALANLLLSTAQRLQGAGVTVRHVGAQTASPRVVGNA
jgi:hypothetical protein